MISKDYYTYYSNGAPIKLIILYCDKLYLLNSYYFNQIVILLYELLYQNGARWLTRAELHIPFITCHGTTPLPTS